MLLVLCVGMPLHFEVHTKTRAVYAKLLPLFAIPLQQEHMSCATEDEEQEEDGINWDVRNDRRRLSECLRCWSIRRCLMAGLRSPVSYVCAYQGRIGIRTGPPAPLGPAVGGVDDMAVLLLSITCHCPGNAIAQQRKHREKYLRLGRV